MTFKKGHTIRKGKKHLLKTKRKISKTKKNQCNVGKKSSNWKGGKPKCLTCNKQLRTYGAIHCKKHINIGNKYSVGAKRSTKTRKKISEAMSGEKSYLWKGWYYF